MKPGAGGTTLRSGQDVGEHMPPDLSRGQQDALDLLLVSGGFGRDLGDLVFEGILQSRRAEFILAEEVELAVTLDPEEIGWVVPAGALGPGHGHQRAIDASEQGIAPDIDKDNGRNST